MTPPPSTPQGLQTPLLLVVGPTASGKSRLAAELGARLDGEVVSADSVQVYRGFDIGSGKVDAEELALCPHHLLDVREPDECLEAMQWAELADTQIAEIQARGRRPIICGGTFLWVRALLYGLAAAPPGDDALRDGHQAFAQEHGRAALHARLAEVDPPSAERLHPNDLVRVSRALEVWELSGEKMSDIQARHGFREQRYPAKLLGVAWESEPYDARVAARVQAMLGGGFREEVAALMEAGHGQSRAMESVGYRQVRDALVAEAAGAPRDDTALAAEIVRATRVFARRQRTWLRDADVEWFGPDVLESPEALDTLAEKLRG